MNSRAATRAWCRGSARPSSSTAACACSRRSAWSCPRSSACRASSSEGSHAGLGGASTGCRVRRDGPDPPLRRPSRRRGHPGLRRDDERRPRAGGLRVRRHLQAHDPVQLRRKQNAELKTAASRCSPSRARSRAAVLTGHDAPFLPPRPRCCPYGRRAAFPPVRGIRCFVPTGQSTAFFLFGTWAGLETDDGVAHALLRLRLVTSRGPPRPLPLPPGLTRPAGLGCKLLASVLQAARFQVAKKQKHWHNCTGDGQKLKSSVINQRTAARAARAILCDTKL